MKSVYATTAAATLIPLGLWTFLLLAVPYSATFSLCLKLVVWGMPAFLLPRLLDRADPIEFLLLRRAPQVKWVLFSVVLLVAYYVLVGGGRSGIHTVTALYLVSAVLISPIIEEAAFRGFVLQKLSRILSFRVGNAATAVLFLLYHLPLWFARGESASIPACLWIVFFSLWMGWVVYRSKSMWTCVVVHSAQNLLFGIA